MWHETASIFKNRSILFRNRQTISGEEFKVRPYLKHKTDLLSLRKYLLWKPVTLTWNIYLHSPAVLYLLEMKPSLINSLWFDCVIKTGMQTSLYGLYWIQPTLKSEQVKIKPHTVQGRLIRGTKTFIHNIPISNGNGVKDQFELFLF